MECELPESLVCYNDGVIDICVDEGIPLGEQILFDENNNNETMKPEPQLTFSTVEDYYMESNLVSEINGKVDTGLIVLEASDDHNQDLPNPIPDYKERGTNEEVIDSIVPNESKDMSKDDDISNEDGLSGPDISLKSGEEKTNSSGISSLQQDRRPLPSLKSLFESTDQQPCQVTISQLFHASERPFVNENATEGNTIFNITKTEPATSNMGNLERVDELSIEPHDAPKLQDMGSDNALVVNPESSFSVAGSISGPLTNSGHIGSTSLRSDSSTTSTRSFAFPILQNEWNSSPVRMAKADRRRLQKHCGWRHGLLCCRF